jgi:hypothetical protein
MKEGCYNTMGKKLEGNGMWESSRMMLPEHRESILESNRHLKDFARPTLDEQEIEFVDDAIRKSIYKRCLVVLKVFDFNQYREVTGTIQRIDPHLKQIKFAVWDPYVNVGEEECEWIKLLDIMKADVKEWDEIGWE